MPKPSYEPLTDAHVRGYAVKSHVGDCVDFHWHFHPELELTYIEKGTGVRQVGRSVQPYQDGDLCLIGANVPHAFGSHPDHRTGARWTVMHFLPEMWGEAFWLLPQNLPIRKMLSKSRRGLRLSGPEVPRCVELLAWLEAKSPDDVPLALWLELMSRLAHCDRKSLNPDGDEGLPARSTDLRLQKVLAWIEANASHPELTQAATARFFQMSPPAFCRFFRLQTGRSYQQYVNELRIARACSSLTDSTRTVSEIAFGTGYNNLSNFNRRFQEIVGCTPSQYRESCEQRKIG